MQKYGTLIEGLDFELNGKLITIWAPIVHLLRKLVIGFTLVYFNKMPYFMIFVFNYCILFQLCFLLWCMPEIDYYENVKSIFNKSVLMGIVYHLFCLTEFLDAEIRSEFIGSSALIVVLICIFVNIAFYVVPAYHRFKLSCKKYNKKYF